MPDLTLVDVSYRINSCLIVENISLSVSYGDWLCIAGCNGSGKSTLLKLMAGLIVPSDGVIAFEGYSYKDLPNKNQKFAVLSQRSKVSADLTVQDLVQLGRYPYLPNWEVRLSSEDMNQVDYALDFVGLNDFRQRSLYTLSGGERQRAFLALALAQNGSILFLDEPTNHLDIVAQNQILNLLERMVASGKIVVSVFHDLNHIAKYSSHLALMRDGQLLQCGPTEEVFCSGFLTEAFGLDIQVVDYEGKRFASY